MSGISSLGSRSGDAAASLNWADASHGTVDISAPHDHGAKGPAPADAAHAGDEVPFNDRFSAPGHLQGRALAMNSTQAASPSSASTGQASNPGFGAAEAKSGKTPRPVFYESTPEPARTAYGKADKILLSHHRVPEDGPVTSAEFHEALGDVLKAQENPNNSPLVQLALDRRATHLMNYASRHGIQLTDEEGDRAVRASFRLMPFAGEGVVPGRGMRGMPAPVRRTTLNRNAAPPEVVPPRADPKTAVPAGQKAGQSGKTTAEPSVPPKVEAQPTTKVDLSKLTTDQLKKFIGPEQTQQLSKLFKAAPKDEAALAKGLTKESAAAYKQLALNIIAKYEKTGNLEGIATQRKRIATLDKFFP